MSIPRVFHRIWLGDEPMPEEFKRFGEIWQSLHPDWEMILWTDATLPPLKNAWAFAQPRAFAAKTNIARYEILLEHGGVYVDTDFECLKNIEPLLQDVECFVAWERQGLANNAIIGAEPGHPFLRDLVDSLEENVRKMLHADPSVTQSGPDFLTGVLHRHREVTVFPAKLFYPYEWHERWRRYEEFPEAYAVHHWSMTWRATKWPQPKQLGDGSAPCLSVVIHSRGDSIRLEWVLEGLCVQTVGDFEVIVVSHAANKSISHLIQKFADRLNIKRYHRRSRREVLSSAKARNLGLRMARAPRTLFLNDDCLPDVDVVEAHASFGGKAFVPFGFQRVYPADKFYRFTPPLDYHGINKYANQEPRYASEVYGDCRDVTDVCLSAPTEALLQIGGFDEHFNGKGAEALARRLCEQKYRLIPMWNAHVTQLARKIFGIGLTRTGTTSLNEALNLLGCRSVHFPDDEVTQSEFFSFFASASKFMRFSLLRDYDAITDTPVCCLYKALDKAYPGSKFILTIRDKEAWLESSRRFMNAVLYPMVHNPANKYFQLINDTLYGPHDYDPARVYDAYHAEVIEYFRERPQDLLILDICGGEGWNKLAPFLGVPIPEGPFPWENQL